MCRGRPAVDAAAFSDTEYLSQLRNRLDDPLVVSRGARTLKGGLQFSCASVTPSDAECWDPTCRGTVDIVRPVADHQHATTLRRDVEGIEDVTDDGLLADSSRSVVSATDECEVRGQTEMIEDVGCDHLILARRQRHRAAGCGEVGEDVGHTVVHGVLQPTGHVVSGTVRADPGLRRRLVVAEGAHRVGERRPDDRLQELGGRRRLPEDVECVQERTADPRVAVGDRAVQVEQEDRVGGDDRSGRGRGLNHASIVHVGWMTMTVDVPSHLRDRSRHGDADVCDGLVDFAVNVRPGPPDFVADALHAAVTDLAAYPSAEAVDAVTNRIARLHGRRPDEVLLLNGAAEGFELLARLEPLHAALIQPSFTEPERVLYATGTRITHVTLTAPWRLADAGVPDDADLVVVGNPTNPTSVLHPRSDVLDLVRPGRIVVVDEAFADLTVDGDRLEPESVAGDGGDGLIVIRSVTKTFGVAGLRAGYLLAAPELVDRMTAGRRHWPVGTLTLAALDACLGTVGQEYAREQAVAVEADRAYMLTRLAEIGVAPDCEPRGPYVLVRVRDAWRWKHELAERGFSVRSCANFHGLTGDHLRLAVRPPEVCDALVAAMQDVRDRLETGGPTR